MKEQESEIERGRGRERRRLMLARGARERVCEPRGAVTEHELQTCQVREGTSLLLLFRQTDNSHKEDLLKRSDRPKANKYNIARRISCRNQPGIPAETELKTEEVQGVVLDEVSKIMVLTSQIYHNEHRTKLTLPHHCPQDCSAPLKRDCADTR